MNEVFRFISVEAPEPLITPPDSVHWGTATPYFKEASEAILDSNNGHAILLSISTAYITSSNYIANVYSLDLPLISFYHEVNYEEGIKHKALDAKVKKLFGMKSEALIEDENFINDKNNLSDSFIAATVVNTASAENRLLLNRGLKTIELLSIIADNADTNKKFNLRYFYSNAILLPETIFPLIIPVPEPPDINRYEFLDNKIEALESELTNYRSAKSELEAVSIEELEAQYVNEIKLLEDHQKLLEVHQKELMRQAVISPPQSIIVKEYIISCSCCEKKCTCECCCKCNKPRTKTPVRQETIDNTVADSAYDGVVIGLIFPDIFVLKKELITSLDASTQIIIKQAMGNSDITIMDLLEYIENKVSDIGNEINTLKDIKNNKRMTTYRLGSATITINALL